MREMARLTGLLIVVVATLIVGLVGPANAADRQISGVGVNTTFNDCPTPAGYGDYTTALPLRMTGSLDGCWFTRSDPSSIKWNTRTGVYQERGMEIFVGRLNGGTEGTFTTTYHFEAKFNPATGAEIRGRCQHPISATSGTGGLSGATGRVDFKDDIATGDFPYRGHISL